MKAIAAAVLLLAALWFSSARQPSVFIRIPRGLSAVALADELANEGALLRKRLFLGAVKMLKMDRKLRYGTYMFSKNAPIFNVIAELNKGIGLLIKVTIPEGFRAQQIAERLEAEGITEAAAFMEYAAKKKLEGRLFPETYYLPPADSARRVGGILEAQFEKIAAELDLETRAASVGLSAHQALVLASIIEKEAANDEEKFLISGIFHNRLQKRMRLESCSTVRYALNKWQRPLSIADTQFESPFNTYRRRGLPPAPICNPGRAALEAAVAPEETELLFFVVDADGNHNFSKYFEEHRKKKFDTRRGR